MSKIAYGTPARHHLYKSDWLDHKKHSRTVKIYDSTGDNLIGEFTVQHATTKAVLMSDGNWWPMEALNVFPQSAEDDSDTSFTAMPWFEKLKQN